MKIVDAFTVYHPAFSVRFIRIGTQFGWSAEVENLTITPELRQPFVGMFSISPDSSVGAAVATMCAQAAKTMSEIVGVDESTLFKYLSEQVEIVRSPETK